jgi:hypothetical protein
MPFRMDGLQRISAGHWMQIDHPQNYALLRCVQRMASAEIITRVPVDTVSVY